MSLMTPHLRETEGGRRRWLPRPCVFASHRHAFCDKISSTCELCSLFPTQISISVSPVSSPVGGILIVLSARSVSLGPARLLALLSFGATPPSTNDTQGLISVQLVANHSASFTCFFIGAFSPEPCARASGSPSIRFRTLWLPSIRAGPLHASPHFPPQPPDS